MSASPKYEPEKIRLEINTATNVFFVSRLKMPNENNAAYATIKSAVVIELNIGATGKNKN